MTKHLLTAALISLFHPAFAASQNGANDYLMTLSPKGQAAMLGKVVGEGCIGRIAFYMGSMDDPHASHSNDVSPLLGTEHDAYWSIRCTNGKSYAVGVNPRGEGKVLECPVPEAIHAGHCFKKFSTH
jgi:hypothetical protein